MKTRTSGSSCWWRWTLSLLALALLAAPAWSQGKGNGGGGGGGKPPTDFPAKVTFRDLFGSDKVVSDNGVSYESGDGAVVAINASTGLMHFELNSSSRFVRMDLSDEWTGAPVTCGGDDPCLSDHQTDPSKDVQQIKMVPLDICGANSDAASEGGLLGIPADSVWRCARLSFWPSDMPFSELNLNWAVRFRPTARPETNEVEVRRINDNTWEVRSQVGGGTTCPDFGDCSALVRTKTTKGKPSGLIIEGYFRTPFGFTIERLQQ